MRMFARSQHLPTATTAEKPTVLHKMVSVIERVSKEVKNDEAYRCHMYKDSENVTSIGYSLNLDDGISERLAAQIDAWIFEELHRELEKVLPF